MLTGYRHVCGTSDLDTVRATMILHHIKSEVLSCSPGFAVLKCEYMYAYICLEAMIYSISVLLTTGTSASISGDDSVLLPSNLLSPLPLIAVQETVIGRGVCNYSCATKISIYCVLFEANVLVIFFRYFRMGDCIAGYLPSHIGLHHCGSSCVVLVSAGHDLSVYSIL